MKHFPQEGVEIIQYWINHEQAQKSWAKEFKVKYDENNWFLDILEAQILKEAPDVVYNTTLTVIPYEFIQRIKNKLTKKAFWICFYGVKRTGEFRRFLEYDLFLTGFRELEKELKTEGQKYYFFPHYFDEKLSSDDFNKERSHALTFLGSLCYEFDNHAFNNRRRIIESLMDSCGAEVYSALGPELNCPKEALRQRFNSLRYEVYHLLNALPFPMNMAKFFPLISQVEEWDVKPTPEYFFNSRLTQKVQPAKYGKALYNILNHSQISINVHGQVDANYGQAKFSAGNIRLFEATGCGTCLLTDQLPHLEEFFEPDKEIVTFANRKEAIEKTRFLMDNPLEREKIARAGHGRAWKDYGSKTRARQFCEILNENV